MSSCQAVTLLSLILPHKNHISKQHSGQMPVQIQTLASLQQGLLYRGSWQFLLDDKKSLIEKWWFIKQPIKYGGQALSGCMYVMFMLFPKFQHITLISWSFFNHPPPKKKTWTLQKKALGLFGGNPKNLQKKPCPQKKTSVGPLELMAGIFSSSFVISPPPGKKWVPTNFNNPPNGDEQKIPRSLLGGSSHLVRG